MIATVIISRSVSCPSDCSTNSSTTVPQSAMPRRLWDVPPVVSGRRSMPHRFQVVYRATKSSTKGTISSTTGSPSGASKIMNPISANQAMPVRSAYCLIFMVSPLRKNAPVQPSGLRRRAYFDDKWCRRRRNPLVKNTIKRFPPLAMTDRSCYQ